MLSNVEVLAADFIDRAEAIDRSGFVRQPLPPRLQSTSRQ